MWISFSVSPSSRRLTGMPVQRADDLRHVVRVDLLFQEHRSFLLRRLGAVAAPLAVAAVTLTTRPRGAARGRPLFFHLRDLPVAQLRRALQVGFAFGSLHLAVRLLQALLQVATRP